MQYKILSASKFNSKLRAAIHASGKLGFTEATSKELGFEAGLEHFVQFAQDSENPSILYLINGTSDDGDSFKVCKSGMYYYVNTKMMFDSLEIDYVGKSVIYDMARVQDEEKEIYKMVKRELDRKANEDK